MSEILDLNINDVFEGPVQLNLTDNNEGVINLTIFSELTSAGKNKSLLHEISQVDFDNGFITVNETALVVEKGNILVFLENGAFKLEYGVDYIINQYNQIYWKGYGFELFVLTGDTLRIYY